MARKPKITVESDHVVTVRFGEHKPTWLEVAEVATTHRLGNYTLAVYNTTTLYNFDCVPNWIATFKLREDLGNA